jgi:hypothetical protein
MKSHIVEIAGTKYDLELFVLAEQHDDDSVTSTFATTPSTIVTFTGFDATWFWLKIKALAVSLDDPPAAATD